MSAGPALDEFRIVRVLGQGGMGTVYLAHDTVLERDVAIKVLRADADVRQRFLTEARAIARLDHPNVIAIYRAATTRDGDPYIVQELVRGASLDRVPLPLEPRRVLEIALGIARGLAAAHRRGILHRDVKPANVMLDDAGTPKLLDFGVAKLAGAPAPPSRRPPASSDVAETLDAPGAARAVVDVTGPTGPAIGTPRYMAPEVWRGEVATSRSDLYSFGVLVYELAAGAPPFPERDMHALAAAVATADPPPLAGDRELAAVAMACLARDPAQRPESADEVVHRLERILAGAPPIPDGNPYPGLAPFSADHRAVFYGRGSEISAVIDRLRSDALVTVAGDSGIGKSSLCRAGVIPAIAAGALGDSRTWTAHTVVLGRHATAALREARELAANGVLVFVDQLEELVTLNAPADASEAAELLADLVHGVPGSKLLLAVRGDFLTRVAALPGLGALLARSLHLLRVLTPADARDVIVGPARDKGVRFESEQLVATLASAVVDQPGALPLLSFTLAELWQHRDIERAVIPAAALDAIGGVTGSLARHADAVIAALGKPERSAARRIALQLVTREGTRDTRTRSELCPDDDPAAAAALEAMIRARLVVAREASYELAHDSLIAAWAMLRGWRDDVAGQRGLRTRLAAAADEWRRLGRRRDALWSRAQLTEIAALDDLSAGDRAFVEASRRAARRRRAIAIAIAASLPVVAATTWFVNQRHAAAQRETAVASHLDVAHQQLEIAEHARDAAATDRREAFRLFDLGTDEAGAEARWAQVRASQTTAHAGYAAAIGELERALSVDPARRDLRGELAHALFARAELAELENDATTAGETAARIAAFDDDGRLVAAWARPAQLHLGVPDRARVELRVTEHGAPIAARDVPVGSYVALITAADGLVVRYPILLARGETFTASVALPPAAAIPRGMLYIPPGRFLSGARTDEDAVRRSFFLAAPLHPRTTAAYLIARHEVTFADWIDYLRALPPEERELRRPSVGAVPILSGNAPFELHFQAAAASPLLVAREGEPLIYPGRDHRARVRWEALPVSGVSFDDATAYGRWLAATGRVPRARLCTDAEWERAARGADARAWSQGDSFDDIDAANIDVTYGRKDASFGPDEVGAHPASTSPFGVDDMTGNVWEWVVGPEDTIVLRGGGWYQDAASAMIANRDVNTHGARQWWAGVRICADAP